MGDVPLEQGQAAPLPGGYSELTTSGTEVDENGLRMGPKEEIKQLSIKRSPRKLCPRK